MSIKSIIFKGELVRALIEGRKTQTRRVLKPHKPAPRYEIGDLLYVKETWRADARFDRRKPSEILSQHPNIEFLADIDTDDDFGTAGKTRNARFMPKRMSRITLKVTNVRTERVQDISDDDAKNEGIECVGLSGLQGGGCIWKDYLNPPTSFTGGHANNGHFASPIESFRSLWETIYAETEYAWNQNPLVAAYTFEVIKQNILEITG